MMAINSDDVLLVSNLRPETTGLPYVVWISQRGDFGHGACVWVSRTLKAIPSEMASVAIRPNVHVVESAGDLAILIKWVVLNLNVLLR
jgi:hypothetical protein